MASRAEDTVDLAKTASEPVHVEMLGSDNIGYKAPLGLAQHCNSKTYSDITIRYDDNMERVFYGHKVLLTAEIRWFNRALSRGFKEADDREIILHGDDPDALLAMLSLPYINGIRKVDGTSHHRNTVYGINLFEVADKYDCPRLYAIAVSLFTQAFTHYLSGLLGDDHPEKYSEDVLLIINRVYELAGGRSGTDILRSLIEQGKAMAGGNNIFGRKLIPLLRVLTKEHLEFGRDVFASLLDNSSIIAGSQPALTPGGGMPNPRRQQ